MSKKAAFAPSEKVVKTIVVLLAIYLGAFFVFGKTQVFKDASSAVTTFFEWVGKATGGDGISIQINFGEDRQENNVSAATAPPEAPAEEEREARFIAQDTGEIFYKRDLIGNQCEICVNDYGGHTRTGPGVDYSKTKEVVKNGEVYQIYDIGIADDNNRVWYKIRKDGLYCWVSSGICYVNGCIGLVKE